MLRPKGEGCSSASGPASRDREASAPAVRKRYVEPKLQSYGALVDVTGFGGSQLLDSGASLQNP